MNEEMHPPDFVMNPGEKGTVVFMQMVFQLSSLASMLLGKVPHPETGETRRDLEAAQMVIDQLEMLETKTHGNLTGDESKLLRQTLMALRMAYVDAVNHPEPGPAEGTETKSPVETAGNESKTEGAGDALQSEESKKRFSKKY